ncbi:MAG TPA: retroviral-like aspartic protease family protein [Stellaceae bacterium]|jgi:clan AA aspartic protease (TIGR02281 family)|nr:retroviral-like aspartic protease family protein [Stellaceae bacterium]
MNRAVIAALAGLLLVSCAPAGKGGSPSQDVMADPAGSADAGEISFRCPAPGTVVEYDSGARLTFSDASGYRCAYSDQTGRRSEKFGALADDAALLDAGLAKLWPLRLGAEQKLAAKNGGFGIAVERFTVLRRETVAVPAGTFDAVVIEQEESIKGVSAREARRQFWLAPELGLIVKSAFVSVREPRYVTDTSGILMPGDYQAMRIVDPRPAPAIAAIPSPAALPPEKSRPQTDIASAPARAPSPSSRQPSAIRVALKMRRGMFVVPVFVNGALALDFLVDSGASDVAVTADVVMTLIHRGTLKESDFTGRKTYSLADGSLVPSDTFIIRSLRVGDKIVENVRGSITSGKGDLLLGQSFLQRFKSWTIDNSTRELVLE